MTDLFTENPNAEQPPVAEPAAESSNGADEPEQMEQAARPARLIEDMSLAEALGRLLTRPLQTWDGLQQVWSRPPAPSTVPVSAGVGGAVSQRRATSAPARTALAAVPFRQRPIAPVAGMGVAFLIALVGSFLLTSAHTNPKPESLLLIGGPLLLIGAVVMGVVVARSFPSTYLPLLAANVPEKSRPREEQLLQYTLRGLLTLVAVIWTWGSWVFNTNNTFTSIGVFCWVMSVLLWYVVLSNADLRLDAWVVRVIRAVRRLAGRTYHFRLSTTFVVLLIILLIGAYFRFTGLGVYPPDMTSDHVEKALDAQRVYDGNRSIFFSNNGGREPFQMYYLAAIKALTGMPVGLEFLQIGSGIEGMLMILLAFWMGRALIGEEDKELGNLTGLIMAAMVATSFWHILLSRLGLRIVTTTLVSTVVLVYLVRALRYNRRSDYLLTGLALGAGMYCYQAVRILPVVVLIGVLLGVILRARTRSDVRRYLVNLAVLIIISLAVFIPLGHYMVQFPLEFWQRTTGRLIGEEGIVDPSKGLDNLKANLPGLPDNFARAVLMFNYKGDMSWFNGAPDGTPELDFFSGALFLVGLGLIGARMVRRRDPADWLLPISILLTVIPSALAIAYSIEVPSMTRASGALPMVYFVAAFGLAYILRAVAQRVPQRWPRAAIYAATILFLALGTLANVNTYFVSAMADYRDAALPHRQAGKILQGFIESTGAPGNAFLPAFANWWDYRALGIEGGDPYWENIIWERPTRHDYFMELLRNNLHTPYEIRPDRQLLFFVSPDDKDFQALLNEWFPQGVMTKVPSFKPSRDFLMFVTPPVGCDWLLKNVGIGPDSCAQVAPESETSTPPAQ